MSEYNYKNCQSLFGYSAEVHVRCKGVCQLCGCGGSLDFDLWRQMTVEHLIGKSQGGYTKQIIIEIESKFPSLTFAESNSLAKKIDALNTVTACQFCNSTTSREFSHISMSDLIKNGKSPADVLKSVGETCQNILEQKRSKVEWKLASVREAFEKHVVPKIGK
ncbi:TPA: hypothetical protein I7243_22930 [Vibrio vulnificus]|nr:hypothetical protein [Vibrio vulnificus]